MMEEVKFITPPKSLCCPVSLQLFVDPVVTLDGQTYERAAITQWFQTKLTSPVTNVPLSSRATVPNQFVKTAVAEWREANHVYTDKEALSLFNSANIDKLAKMQRLEGSAPMWELPADRQAAWTTVARLNSMPLFEWLDKQIGTIWTDSLIKFDRIDMLKEAESRIPGTVTLDEQKKQFATACSNASFECLFYLVLQKGPMDIASLIAENGDGNALHLLAGAAREHAEAIDKCARLLLDHKVNTQWENTSSRKPLEEAIDRGNVRLVAFLRRMRPAEAPRNWLAAIENAKSPTVTVDLLYPIARTLVESGLSPKRDDHSILHIAAKWATADNIRSMEMLEWALTLGIDVNTRYESGTPLHWCNYAPAIRKLVERGADLEALDGDGRTPILAALGEQGMGDADYTRAAQLYVLGASLEAKVPDGQTADEIIDDLHEGDQSMFWSGVAIFYREQNQAHVLEQSRDSEHRLREELKAVQYNESKMSDEVVKLRDEAVELRAKLVAFEAEAAKRAESNRKRRESRKRKAEGFVDERPSAAKKQEREIEDLTASMD